MNPHPGACGGPTASANAHLDLLRVCEQDIEHLLLEHALCQHSVLPRSCGGNDTPEDIFQDAPPGCGSRVLCHVLWAHERRFTSSALLLPTPSHLLALSLLEAHLAQALCFAQNPGLP